MTDTHPQNVAQLSITGSKAKAAPVPAPLPPEVPWPPPEEPAPERTDAHYALFLDQLQELTAMKALSTKELAARLGLREVQVRDWMTLAVEQGRASKVGKTRRYRWRAGLAQGSLFE